MRDGAWSLVELPTLSRPIWRDANTLDVVTFTQRTNDEGQSGFEACLQRVERDAATATEIACWPGWMHGRPLRPVPGDRDHAILRLDPPRGDTTRLLLIRRSDGSVLRETTIPRRHVILRVLEGARVLSAHDGQVRLLDFMAARRVDFGPTELGGTLTRVLRHEVDGVERVYGQVSVDENRHRLVELDLSPLRADADQSARRASRNAATRR